MKMKLLFGTILIFLASCSVKNSCQSLEIYNNTSDTIIVEYNTSSYEGVKIIPFISDASNKPTVYSLTIYDCYYPNIDKLPLLTNDDIKAIIKKLNIYKIYNGDTVKLDINYYDINNWKLHEFVDDEIRAYYYTLYLDKNAY